VAGKKAEMRNLAFNGEKVCDAQFETLPVADHGNFCEQMLHPFLVSLLILRASMANRMFPKMSPCLGPNPIFGIHLKLNINTKIVL